MTMAATTYLTGGIATGVGSLPHRDARAAAEFALVTTPDLPAIPSLPKRSPADSMIAQAVVGIRGISVGQYGSIVVDVPRVDPFAPACPICMPNFASLLACTQSTTRRHAAACADV